MVVFDPDTAWWARRQLPASAVVAERPDGSLRVALTVANQDAFIGWLLGFEERAEVLEPAGLRELVVDRVRGVA